MSHTNSTPYYGLPQYVGTDIINPLVDTNGAYSDIDTALHNIADAESTVAGKVETLETTVGDNTAGLVKNVSDLETQNGDSVLTTTAQTLSGAINELDGDITTANTNIGTNAGNITGLQQKVGSDTLNTTAQTCTGAINELDAEVTGLTTTVGDANSGLVRNVSQIDSLLSNNYVLKELHRITVTGDGVKTYQQLFKELIDDTFTYIQSLSSKSLAIVKEANIGTWMKCVHETWETDASSGLGVTFAATSISASVSQFFEATFRTDNISYNHFNRLSITSAPAYSYESLDSEVVVNGTNLTMAVDVYVKL